MSHPHDLEAWAVPPVAELLTSATRLHGNHTHVTWRGLAHPAGTTTPGLEMVLKWMPRQQQVAVELACAMAADVLGIAVPLGSLVICARDQLPGLPDYARGDPVVCFGSHFKRTSTQYVTSVNDPAIEDLIWNRVCASTTGPAGAAWDELAANSDRHCENLLFDGARWWLFDHDLALEPISTWAQGFAEQVTRHGIAQHRAAENQLAERMLRLRPNDHGLDREPRALVRQRARVALLADLVRGGWHSDHPAIAPIIPLVEVTLRSIDLRLPALPMHLSTRIGRTGNAALWDPPRTA